MNNLSTIAASSSLTSEEIERFGNDGFLVINDLFTADEIAELRSAVEAPDTANAVTIAGGEYQTVHLLGLTARHPIFRALALDSRIVGRLVPLIGPDIQLQHSKLATQSRTAGQGGFGWHQDFAFFPHTNARLIAVMVMLDDALPENGCMYMLPGSHRLGLRNHDINGFFTGKCQESDLWEGNSAQPTAIIPRAGGISIHHCLTLHGSGPNASGLPRRGIVFQYRADDAYQLADEVWPDTGFVVSGERRGYVRCDSQRIRLPLHNVGEGNNPYRAAWNQEGEAAREWNRLGEL